MAGVRDETEKAATNLPPIVYKLGWVSFFADVSSEVAYPLIPLFMTEVLKAPALALGAVEGASEAVVSFMKGWSGMHSDRSGRRAPYIQAGYGLSAIGKPLIAFAAAWPMVLVARITDRLGKGVRTTSRDALIADAIAPTHYGRAYGLHGGMDTAGAFTGVLLAALLLWSAATDYRTIFLLAGIPGAISFLITLTVKDKPVSRSEDRPAVVSIRELPKAYWWALGACTVFALANSTNTLLLLRARNEGFSPLQVVLAYALYNLVFTLVSYPAGSLSDRFGRWRVLVTGWLAYAGVYIGFASLGGQTIWLLFALYGVVIGITTGVNKALVADLSPKNGRGTALGIFYMTTGFATLISSIIGGLLWDLYGPAATFLFGAVLAAIAAALVPIYLFATRVR